MIKSLRFKPNRTGEVLRNIRTHSGMSQQDIAGAMSLNSPSAISHYERGLRGISLDALQRFAAVLGYDVEIRLVKR